MLHVTDVPVDVAGCNVVPEGQYSSWVRRVDRLAHCSCDLATRPPMLLASTMSATRLILLLCLVSGVAMAADNPKAQPVESKHCQRSTAWTCSLVSNSRLNCHSAAAAYAAAS
jgi:hypothetical protein